jgi:hypothetical protein
MVSEVSSVMESPQIVTSPVQSQEIAADPSDKSLILKSYFFLFTTFEYYSSIESSLSIRYLFGWSMLAIRLIFLCLKEGENLLLFKSSL